MREIISPQTLKRLLVVLAALLALLFLSEAGYFAWVLTRNNHIEKADLIVTFEGGYDRVRAAYRLVDQALITKIQRSHHGFRGLGGEEIYRFAQEEKTILLTGDLGFGNILSFPLSQHFWIVVARLLTQMRPKEINREIMARLKDLKEKDFKGNLIILEPGRIRIRRART